MRRLLVVAVTLLLFTSTRADIAVAQRRGFIIGIGLGGAVLSREAVAFGGSSNSETTFGFVTDFKIGAEVSDAVQVYYTSIGTWAGGGDQYSSTTLNAWSGVGVTYRLRPGPVAPYLDGLVGLASFTELDLNIDSGPGASGTGFGFGLGAGYEFADRWMLDLDFAYGRPSIDGVGSTAWTIKLSLNLLSH